MIHTTASAVPPVDNSPGLAAPAANGNTTAGIAALEAMRVADVDPAQGLPVAEHASALARRERDYAAGAVAERAWGHALVHCGELDDAIRHFRRSVKLGVRADSPTLVAEARQKLAFVVMQRGRPRAALTEIDAALEDLTGASAGRARAQRAIILHIIGRLDESLQEYEIALKVLRATGDQLGVQRMLINRALVYADRHAFPAARRDLAEAEVLAKQLGRELTVGIIANNLGLVETLYGDVPSALAHLERAERIVGAHGAQLGTLYQDRAELLLSVGLVTEAQIAAQQAVAAYRREHRLVKIPEVRLLSAQAAMLDSDWAAAADQAQRSLREFAGQDRVEWAALARLAVLRARQAQGVRPRVRAELIDDMVNTLTHAGWPAAAMEANLVAARLSESATHSHPNGYLDQAARASGRNGPASLRARGWYAKARRRRSDGDPRGSMRAARAGLRILEEHSASMAATDLRVHAAANRSELVELGLGIAFEVGRPSGVFEWAERGRASQLLHPQVRPPDEPELTELLVELRALTREIDSRRGAGGRSTKVARQVALEQQIRDRTRQLRGSPAERPSEPVKPVDLGNALGDWALVEYIQLAGQLYGLTMADGRMALRRLACLTDISDLTDRLPFALRRMALRNGRSERGAAASMLLLQTTAARLDALLISPLAELGSRPLVVVPTGPLHGLPWSILPSCRGRPITVSPSATLWHSSSRHAEGPAGQVVVVAGPTLPGAAEEARAVAEIYSCHPLAGPSATVDAVLKSLSTAGVAHLAAHGRLAADNPLFSEISLADGPLVAYDLERLPRVPHTVVLAACESGRAVVHTGDELIGLSVTFLARGTTQLIASVVPVPDAETTPLMVRFHRLLAAGAAPAVALATAQQELSGQGEGRSLAAAAGFICIGSGKHSLLPMRRQAVR